MDLNNFNPGKMLVKSVETFLKEYSLREVKYRGNYALTSKSQPRTLMTLGKDKIGDFDGGLILSRYRPPQPDGESYCKHEVIAFLNSDLDKVIRKIEDNRFDIGDPDKGLIFRLDAVTNHSRYSTTHWHGFSCYSSIRTKDYSNGISIEGPDADSLLSLAGL